MIRKIFLTLFSMSKKRLKKLIELLNLNPILKNDNFKGRTFIFGYGSLVGASGINGRGMRRFYQDKDLTETYLNNYKREVNARAGERSCSYYGISYALGHKTNGVIFEINEEDIFNFKISEGFGLGKFRPYNLVDVTDLVDYNVWKGNRVLTCVTNNKAIGKDIWIADHYRVKVYEALICRSPEFKKNFSPDISANFYNYYEW